MELSKEDIKILTLEKKRRELYKKYAGMPNNVARYKLWKKDSDLTRKLGVLIFDREGNFKTSKKHLLINNSLNIGLLNKR